MDGTEEQLESMGEVMFRFHEETIPVAVSCGDTILHYWRGTSPIDFGFVKGDKLKEGSLMRRALESKQRVCAVIPKDKSMFGFAYSATAMPIFDNHGNVLGIIAQGFELDKQDTLISLANQLGFIFNKTNEVFNDITNLLLTLNDMTSELSKNAKETMVEVGTIKEIVDLVKYVSSQTNLLSLNAAIEASSAKENGRGFSVIAEEMGKLSQISGDNTNKISKKLRNIMDSVLAITEKTNDFSQLSTKTAQATEDVSVFVKDLEKCKQEIQKIANEMFK